MTPPAPSFDFRLVDTPAGSLPCIVRGPSDGAQVLVVPPLFEEMNRTRTLLAGVGRRLTQRGIGSWLPDLPGSGDHELPLTAVRLATWRSSVDALAQVIAATNGSTVHLFAIRGGALLAGSAAATRYLLAPVESGERLLRELMRARLSADQERGRPSGMAALEARLKQETVELAGYPITPALAADLRSATLLDAPRTRRVALDGGSGDRLFDGPPLWRQAEPVAAPDLAREIGDDLADWIESCAAR